MICDFDFVLALRAMMAYVQCTPPPPTVFDLFPKPCRSPIDCFPNLCCQEGDKKFCRPKCHGFVQFFLSKWFQPFLRYFEKKQHFFHARLQYLTIPLYGKVKKMAKIF